MTSQLPPDHQKRISNIIPLAPKQIDGHIAVKYQILKDILFLVAGAPTNFLCQSSIPSFHLEGCVWHFPNVSNFPPSTCMRHSTSRRRRRSEGRSCLLGSSRIPNPANSTLPDCVEIILLDSQTANVPWTSPLIPGPTTPGVIIFQPAIRKHPQVSFYSSPTWALWLQPCPGLHTHFP